MIMTALEGIAGSVTLAAGRYNTRIELNVLERSANSVVFARYGCGMRNVMGANRFDCPRIETIFSANSYLVIGVLQP